MTATKDYFDQIVQNQSKFMAALTEYTTEAVESMMPEKEFTEKTNALLQDYLSRPAELAEVFSDKKHAEQYQKDFWNTLSADYSRGMEASMELYRKTTDHFRDFWTKFTLTDQQSRAKKFSEIAQKCMKAYMEAGNANARVTQEFFKT